MTQRIPIVENILNANDRLAEENRARLDAAQVAYDTADHFVLMEEAARSEDRSEEQIFVHAVVQRELERHAHLPFEHHEAQGHDDGLVQQIHRIGRWGGVLQEGPTPT